MSVDQLEAFDRILELQSEERLLIEGEGGTGKSFVIARAIEFILRNDDDTWTSTLTNLLTTILPKTNYGTGLNQPLNLTLVLHTIDIQFLIE
jgi:ABC-type dipeptide/oligopeptide/nickel transport system ATPase component